MAKYSTADLLGLPPQICTDMANSLSYIEYMKVAIALLQMRKTDTVDDYQTDLWKYRDKAVGFYEDRLKEFR